MIRMKIIADLNFPMVEKAFEEAIIRGLQKGAYAMERTAKGYAPYNTGQLTASINTYPVEKTSHGYLIQVGPSVTHGIYMEIPGGLGPKSIMKGARRPYLRPAIIENQSSITKFLIEEIRGIR